MPRSSCFHRHLVDGHLTELVIDQINADFFFFSLSISRTWRSGIRVPFEQAQDMEITLAVLFSSSHRTGPPMRPTNSYNP